MTIRSRFEPPGRECTSAGSPSLLRIPGRPGGTSFRSVPLHLSFLPLLTVALSSAVYSHGVRPESRKVGLCNQKKEPDSSFLNSGRTPTQFRR